jgi:hypothetical protein
MRDKHSPLTRAMFNILSSKQVNTISNAERVDIIP